ncbi:hypothetical protein KIPB_006753, partial [Kipferlia bialata]
SHGTSGHDSMEDSVASLRLAQLQQRGRISHLGKRGADGLGLVMATANTYQVRMTGLVSEPSLARATAFRGASVVSTQGTQETLSRVPQACKAMAEFTTSDSLHKGVVVAQTVFALPPPTRPILDAFIGICPGVVPEGVKGKGSLAEVRSDLDTLDATLQGMATHLPSGTVMVLVLPPVLDGDQGHAVMWVV